MIKQFEIEQVQNFLNCFSTLESGIYCYDINAKTIMVTEGIEKILGRSKEEINYNTWKKAVYQEDKRKVYRWRKQIILKMESGCLCYRIIRPDGQIRWVEDHFTSRMGISEQLKGFAGLIINITEQKEAELKIEYMAFNDTLTGLPNRNMLKVYFPKAVARCKRKNTQLAIMYVDLDKFKTVNDTLGHEIGDQLLKQVGERLTWCVRKGDIVSRQGGDEFVILLEETDLSNSRMIAQRVLEAVLQPFIIDMQKIDISASIGITLYPADGEDLDTLIRHADEAMYSCKDFRTSYRFYTAH